MGSCCFLQATASMATDQPIYICVRALPEGHGANRLIAVSIPPLTSFHRLLLRIIKPSILLVMKDPERWGVWIFMLPIAEARMNGRSRKIWARQSIQKMMNSVSLFRRMKMLFMCLPIVRVLLEVLIFGASFRTL